MYDQIREDPLYIMLYAVVTALAIMASCYLLFGRANVIAPEIKPPMRLRRWTAAFFASFAISIPLMRIVPLVGLMTPVIALIVVDLPAPL